MGILGAPNFALKPIIASVGRVIDSTINSTTIVFDMSKDDVK